MSNPISSLIDIAKDDSLESRHALVESIAEIWLTQNVELNDQEQYLVYDILAQLLTTIGTDLKRNLSEILSQRNDPPKDIILSLAKDDIDVASPILLNSIHLDDADLIQLIIEKTDAHQIAISNRENISESVTSHLVETDNNDVILSLLNNQTAQVSDQTMNQIADKSRMEKKLQEPLLNRQDLKETIAKRMYEWVGDALKTHIQEKFSTTQFSDAVTTAIHTTIEQNVPAQTQHLDKNFNITLENQAPIYKPLSRTLLLALKKGDIYRFEELFVDLTELNHELVTEIIYDKGPEALAIACKASGLGVADFSDILCYIKRSQSPDSFRETKLHKQMVDYFTKMNLEGAKKILDSWRLTQKKSR